MHFEIVLDVLLRQQTLGPGLTLFFLFFNFFFNQLLNKRFTFCFFRFMFYACLFFFINIFYNQPLSVLWDLFLLQTQYLRTYSTLALSVFGLGECVVRLLLWYLPSLKVTLIHFVRRETDRVWIWPSNRSKHHRAFGDSGLLRSHIGTRDRRQLEYS